MAKRDVHVAIMKSAAKGSRLGLWLSADEVKQLSEHSSVQAQALKAVDFDTVARQWPINWKFIQNPPV